MRFIYKYCMYIIILLISKVLATTVNTSCAWKYENLFDGHEETTTERITHNTQIKVIPMGF